MAGFTTRLYFDVALCAASYVFNVSSSSVLFYAQIQCVYDRFKNTSSGLAVTAPSLAIAWSKVISFEAIALDKASRQVTAVCRTPYPVSWQWFNKMWADLDNPDAFAPAVAQISIAVINFFINAQASQRVLHPESRTYCYCRCSHWSLHFVFKFLEFFASLARDRDARSHLGMLGC